MNDRAPFDVWAPTAERVRLAVGDDVVEMDRDARTAGGRPPSPCRDGEVDYGYLLDDDETVLPDPRSRRQPDGPHGRSRTVDLAAYEWGDRGWTGLAARRGGRLRAARRDVHSRGHAGCRDRTRIDHLLSLGVGLVELMPVNGFDGTHNWGYDGVGWFVVDETYGGPAAYQRFVDACHQAGLGVVQDVVYNHLGPSGQLPAEVRPLPQAPAATPGATSVNLDGEGSAEVRRYILDNVRMWLEDYHVDGLRLDAVHALRGLLARAPAGGDGGRGGGAARPGSAGR